MRTIKKGIIKKILLICFIAVIIGIVFFAISRGRGSGGNGLISDIFEYDEVISHDTQEEHEEVIESPLLIIEIHEDRIYYNNIEVTLYELEEILIANSDDTWEVYDAYRAHRTTFEAVTELLTRFDIFFRER